MVVAALQRPELRAASRLNQLLNCAVLNTPRVLQMRLPITLAPHARAEKKPHSTANSWARACVTAVNEGVQNANEMSAMTAADSPNTRLIIRRYPPNLKDQAQSSRTLLVP